MLSTHQGLLSVFLVAFLSCGVAAVEHPNVVLIISDDQGWTDFGFMGHKVVKTPNLDKLAAQSAVFPNGYVPTPLCRPSLASIITGLYPHQHKLCCNDPPKGMDRNKMLPFLASVPTLPRMLAKAGYKSLQTGKFWEGHYSNGGFTHGMTENKVGGRHGDKGLAIGRGGMKPIFDFIDECGNTPFFIWYAPFMPHTPHNPPDRILKKYALKDRSIRLAKYWAMCEWFDETCGELFNYLDTKGLTDKTLVAFVVDNGWIQDPRPRKDKSNPPGLKGKLSPYDGGLRTPIMLCWPGHTKAGRYLDLVSSIDLAPTILAACGLKPTEQMPGLNLLEVATGKIRLERKTVFGEVYGHTALDIYHPARNLTHRWVRQDNWKLIHPEQKGEKDQLYDLVKDPTEEKNLAELHPEKVRQLTGMLDDWWRGKPAD